MSDPVICALKGCQRRIPQSRLRNGAKYCTHAHGAKARSQRHEVKAKAKRDAKRKVLQASQNSTERKGQVYRWLMDAGNRRITDGLLEGSIEPAYVAHLIGCTTSAVSRALTAVITTREMEELKAEWEPTWRVKAMLPAGKLNLLKKLEVDSDDFTQLLDEMVRAYSVFSRWYFRLEGKRPLVKDFHLNWIRAIIRAYATGGKQLILSPPRHGKSEMLVRFCVWFIVMDPNIRIGWFCSSSDVAKLMLGAVRDYLENHEELIGDTLPPGDVYKPEHGGGKPWSAKEIKVRQQSHIGQKSSSLLALGRTSKFLSRDMDIIIVDDMEDFDDTREPAQREYSRNKLAEIDTRKMEHTAMVYIGSRQHPDDIPNHILALEGSILQWRVIVDTAHDENCPHDPDDFDVHTDCMLFPEVRSYRWLMEKKLSVETLGLPHMYPMRYLNRPLPPEGQVFNVELIREVALNRNRGIGLTDLPLGYLVGGLDPSARGTQASFLWHYRSDPEMQQGLKMSMVDLDTMKAGGMDGAVKVMLDWYERYGLTLWFYEANSQQMDFYNHVKKRVQKVHPEIVVKDINTGRNKRDAELGISSMAPLYHAGAIDLPYGTNEARVKVNGLLRQLELWTTDGVISKKAVTDIKMASWFPWAGRIQRFAKEQRKVKTKVHGEPSYPNVRGYSDAPWGRTGYPGGR